jgi:hypothetical protein
MRVPKFHALFTCFFDCSFDASGVICVRTAYPLSPPGFIWIQICLRSETSNQALLPNEFRNKHARYSLAESSYYFSVAYLLSNSVLEAETVLMLFIHGFHLYCVKITMLFSQKCTKS